jgi:hypothetical protein
MLYCPKCGVEVEGRKCPLCLYVIKQDIHKVPFSHTVELDKSAIFISLKDKKNIYNVSTIFFAILLSAVCLTTDLIFDKVITWSIYPLIISFTMVLITSVALYIKGILKVILILILALSMLFLIDIFIPVRNFFLMISLPVSCIITLLTFSIVLLSKRSRQGKINIAGYILIAIALLAIAIDIIVNNFIYNKIGLTWSLITTVSLIPVAVFLLYIHYILSKRVDLKKIFHT